MSDGAIHVKNLSKLYRIGPPECYKALHDTLTSALYASFRVVAFVLNGPRSAVGRQRSRHSLMAEVDDGLRATGETH